MSETDKKDHKESDERVPMTAAVANAVEQLSALLGSEAVQVSALKATDDGWAADVEVVEILRVPDTTSVMASYRVSLDKHGDLTAYERLRRYPRGQVDH